MTLPQLKRICAAYHNKKVAELTDTGADIDMFLIAANNARKAAERGHNFESSWCKATVLVDPVTGGALSSAVLDPSVPFSGVKEIIAVTDAAGRPYVLRRPGSGAARLVPRVPTDGQAVTSADQYLILRGDKLYQHPTVAGAQVQTVYLEAYGWLKDYVDADLLESVVTTPKDFLVEYGFEFLQWAIVIELNYTFQSFVFRQEGNPGSPEKLKESAWEKLVEWDSWRVAPHFHDER